MTPAIMPAGVDFGADAAAAVAVAGAGPDENHRATASANVSSGRTPSKLLIVQRGRSLIAFTAKGCHKQQKLEQTCRRLT